MKLYWKRAPKPGNFGDVLTPYIFDYFNIAYTYSDTDYSAISTGSIANKAQAGTDVFGSGIISSKDKLCATARWHFVRGPLTRQRVLDSGGQCPEIYGDPAMLLPLISKPLPKSVEVAIVPHYVDYDYVVNNYPNYRVINLLNADPLKVAQEISQCATVISSSLHGIICAHAYGIPAAWIKFSNKLKGDDTKFKDHFAAMGLECKLSTWDRLSFSAATFDIGPIVNIFENFADEQLDIS